MMEYFLVAPVASAIFAVTILTSILAFSNENLYSNFILQPYAVYRGQRPYTRFNKRPYPCRLDAPVF